jgi:two-component system phosphate regulon response regulator PhoB
MMNQSTDKKTVLVVEDDLGMRIFLKTLLETSGYRSVMAANGRSGLDKAQTEKPDLILLDVMMPKQGGALMYVHLKTDDQLKQIPVVMLSAVGSRTFYHYLMMHNAQADTHIPEPEAYVEKPPDPRVLLRILKKVI